MVKFVVLFRRPKNLKKFEDNYNNFLALIERMPAIARRQVNSVNGSPLGASQYYRILEIYFDSQDALNASLLSPAGQEAGGELSNFGAGTFEVLFADVYEEQGGHTEKADENNAGA